MRICVTGAEGMVGREVVELLSLNREVVGWSRNQFDVGDPEYSARLANGEFGGFDAIVNCAAYTAVDKAESDEENAAFINALGPGYLSQASRAMGAQLIHLSTDFVFNGKNEAPYVEEDAPDPLSVYGRTKLVGEQAVAENHRAVVLRTSWVFGQYRNNFAKSMICAYEAGKHLRVVDDQVGCPTYSADIAATIEAVLSNDPVPGIYHACGPEAMTWRVFAERILSSWTGKTIQIEPITTSEWPTSATRPRYSVLDCSKLHSAKCYPMRSLDRAIVDLVAKLRANPSLLDPS